MCSRDSVRRQEYSANSGSASRKDAWASANRVPSGVMSFAVTRPSPPPPAPARSARQLLRRCLRKPLKVTPDGHGGWTFEGEGWFAPKDLHEVVERIGAGSAPEIIVPPLGTELRLENREVQGRLTAHSAAIHSTWCRERGSNPHGL